MGQRPRAVTSIAAIQGRTKGEDEQDYKAPLRLLQNPALARESGTLKLIRKDAHQV